MNNIKVKYMDFKSILTVAFGSAVGAVLRYLISLLPFKSEIPVATLLVNVIGAVMIGFVAGFAGERAVGKNVVLFFKTGVCGGFSTFSAFSLESLYFFENEKTALGVIYIFLSVLGCLAGVCAGTAIGRYIGKT